MPLIGRIKEVNRYLLYPLFTVLLLYTLIHFSYSGIYFPLVHGEKIGQIEEELVPLARFLKGGEFVFNNPRQYGPFFILAITPLMVFHNNGFNFATALLIVSYMLITLSFCICYRHIFQFRDKTEKTLTFWICLFLWLNFSPLLYIITVRNVEVWELFLICLGFLAYIKRRYFITGFSFAAATLTKMLPGIYIFYYFFKHKKTFFYSLLGLGIITALAHVIFGPSIGSGYIPFLLTRPFGSRTWAVTFFENTSLKGFIYKLFGGFKTDSFGYNFLISPEAEKAAFIAITVLQAVILFYLARMALKKDGSKEGLIIQLSLVSIAMVILSPISAFEYGTLLLFAYSAGIYFILYREIPKYMYAIYGISYLLVGNFFPVSMFARIFPLKTLNSLLGNTRFDLAESYKAYCIPLVGFLLLAVFFVLLLRNKKTAAPEKQRQEII